MVLIPVCRRFDINIIVIGSGRQVGSRFNGCNYDLIRVLFYYRGQRYKFPFVLALLSLSFPSFLLTTRGIYTRYKISSIPGDSSHTDHLQDRRKKK